MGINMKILLEKIIPILSGSFSRHGFILRRKQYFERQDKYGNTHQYEIRAPFRNGYFHFHLILNLLNKGIKKQMNPILEQVYRDPSYNGFQGLASTKVERAIKDRLTSNWMYSVTDWRNIRNETESLEEFNKRFHIWFCSFEDVEEVSDWEGQLQMSADMAAHWFNGVGSQEWIIANTEFPSMFILKKENRID